MQLSVSELMASMRLGSGSASDDFRRDVTDDVELIKASRTVTQCHYLSLTFLCLTGLRCFKPAKSRRLRRRFGFIGFGLSGFATFLLTFRHGMSFEVWGLVEHAQYRIADRLHESRPLIPLLEKLQVMLHGGRLAREPIRAIIANQAFDLVPAKQPKRI